MSRRHLTEGLGRGNRSRLDPAAATGQLEGDLMLTVDVMGGRTCVRTVDVFHSIVPTATCVVPCSGMYTIVILNNLNETQQSTTVRSSDSHLTAQTY